MSQTLNSDHECLIFIDTFRGRRESDKGLAVQTEPQAPVAQQGCLFCCDKRSPGCVGRARRSLVRRTSRTPPRSLLRLPAVAKGSPLSRDETLPGTGPLQRRSNAKVFARRCTR